MSSSSRELRPGDWVTVRSEAEILATLDADGTLLSLPFMPEMRRFCGHSFRVRSRADRTVVEGSGLRRLQGTVHLEGTRCSGAAHDGCCRGCLIFWKEAWLRPLPAAPLQLSEPRDDDLAPVPGRPLKQGDRYFCQATELAQASAPLSAKDLRRHLRAVIDEDTRARDLLTSLAIYGYDLLMERVLKRQEWNHIAGPCTQTPATSLGLVPLERVRVRSREEIVATLDQNGWNRRMEFSREMLPYCGQEFTVLRRVDRIIGDHHGRMIKLKNTVILDGLVYRALNRLACPRSEYMFWRECWLERTGSTMGTIANNPIDTRKTAGVGFNHAG